jgi:Zn-dependent protease
LRFLRNNPIAVFLILYMAYQSFTSQQYNGPMDWFMSKLIILPAILIGLSFHEFAHAFAADRLGDQTPKLQGRVTINPAAHLDPFGFLALFFIGFGWGKPVEVNPWNFKKMRRDSLIVDLAGVTINLILAVIFAGVLKLLSVYHFAFLGTYMGSVVVKMIFDIVSINIVLMVFNLIPVPPLDGFGIVTEIFDLRKKEWYNQIYSNGFMILLLLMIFNVTDKIMVPGVNFVLNAIMGIYF